MGQKEQSESFLRDRFSYQVKEPHKYAVVMYNDDFTPMDFVVELLKLVFHYDAGKAYELMMTVHKSGEAVVGTYTYDIAATKRARAMSMAKEAGYPFRVEMREV